MTERRKFGEFKQNRFITVIEMDNLCGIEDLMKQKKYGGFREKDYRKLCSIHEELNQLYYENEQLKQGIIDCIFEGESLQIFAEKMGLIE